MATACIQSFKRHLIILTKNPLDLPQQQADNYKKRASLYGEREAITREDIMRIESLMLVFTGVLAFATIWLACSTFSLAKSTVKMANETREASVRQLGVQTWLQLASRFDSAEIRRARGKLAEQMQNYDASRHDEVTEEVLDVFEDIGTVYKLELINKELADSAFSYYASRWWEVAKTYIYEERERNRDNQIFSDFEAFAREMRRPDEKLDDLGLKKFLNDEEQLNRP
jgi:hypothetical protein